MRLKHTLLMATFLTFSAPAFADEYVVMKVNNQDISSADVEHMWEGLFPPGEAPALDKSQPELREKIMRAVMAEKLVYAEALKAGTDKSDALQRQLEDMKRKLIVRQFLDSKSGDGISEAAIKKEYDSMVADLKNAKEVHARHILVKTEDEAKAAKKKLDEGKTFDEVAKEFSKDPGSAEKGGDLGYFTRDKMVKEFADAAFAMKKGEVSGPVKSGFGYHIIKVEDVRKVTPAPKVPTYAEMKDQLKTKLQEKKLNDYVTGLVKAADVKVFDAKGKEMPFDKELPLADGAAAEAAAH